PRSRACRGTAVIAAVPTGGGHGPLASRRRGTHPEAVTHSLPLPGCCAVPSRDRPYPAGCRSGGGPSCRSRGGLPANMLAGLSISSRCFVFSTLVSAGDVSTCEMHEKGVPMLRDALTLWYWLANFAARGDLPGVDDLAVADDLHLVLEVDRRAYVVRDD